MHTDVQIISAHATYNANVIGCFITAEKHIIGSNVQTQSSLWGNRQSSLWCTVRGFQATACVPPCVCFYFKSAEDLLSRLKSSRIRFFLSPPPTQKQMITRAINVDNIDRQKSLVFRNSMRLGIFMTLASSLLLHCTLKFTTWLLSISRSHALISGSLSGALFYSSTQTPSDTIL